MATGGAGVTVLGAPLGVSAYRSGEIPKEPVLGGPVVLLLALPDGDWLEDRPAVARPRRQRAFPFLLLAGKPVVGEPVRREAQFSLLGQGDELGHQLGGDLLAVVRFEVAAPAQNVGGILD